MIRFSLFFVIYLTFVLSGCKKDDENNDSVEVEPKVTFVFHFDPDQARLDNFGNPASVPQGHAAQTPVFSKISAHYVELIPSPLTQLGEGQVLYSAPETTAGGDIAIDFQQSLQKGEGQAFLSVPVSSIQNGTYPWLRVSLAYQEYDIQLLASGIEINGRLASFIGYNTYITNFDLNGANVDVNANKPQGYWAFNALGNVFQGQSPAGATTVVNPLSATSPIPPGSCLVTGTFTEPLVIDQSTGDITVTVSLSINQSFEWEEVNADGKYEPAAGEQVVDMGIRGMIPSWE